MVTCGVGADYDRQTVQAIEAALGGSSFIHVDSMGALEEAKPLLRSLGSVGAYREAGETWFSSAEDATVYVQYQYCDVAPAATTVSKRLFTQ